MVERGEFYVLLFVLLPSWKMPPSSDNTPATANIHATLFSSSHYVQLTGGSSSWPAWKHFRLEILEMDLWVFTLGLLADSQKTHQKTKKLQLKIIWSSHLILKHTLKIVRAASLDIREAKYGTFCFSTTVNKGINPHFSCKNPSVNYAKVKMQHDKPRRNTSSCI